MESVAATEAREQREEGGAGPDGVLEQWIRAGLVKAPAAAASKAAVWYGGDVSRVVDVCRVRLAAESPGQVGRARRDHGVGARTRGVSRCTPTYASWRARD